MKNKFLSALKFFPVIFCVLSFSVLLIAVPQVAFDGVRTGLSLCAQTVIPSIFPFMVLSLFFVKSGLCEKLGFLFSPVMRFVFKLPACCAGVFIMGALGGYPVGAKMTSSLLENGSISENDARRMMMFCINPGPAFVVSAVGYAMLGSIRAGVIIYVSLLLSSITVGIFTAIFTGEKPPIHSTVFGKGLSFSKALIQSCAESSSSMISICSWVILFSCIGGFLSLFISNENLLSVLRYILEVTSGCAYAAHHTNLPVIAAVLGFSGFCVHMQIMPDIVKSRLKLSLFLAMRLLHAGLSSVIAYGLLKIFPYYQAVFAPVSSFYAYGISYSLPVAIGLIIMGILLIFEVAESKKVC